MEDNTVGVKMAVNTRVQEIIESLSVNFPEGAEQENAAQFYTDLSVAVAAYGMAAGVDVHSQFAVQSSAIALVKNRL